MKKDIKKFKTKSSFIEEKKSKKIFEKKIEEISSLANQKVKRLFKLSKDIKFRQTENIIVIDGCREIEEALKNSWPIDEFYFCEKFITEKDRSAFIKIKEKANHLISLSPAAFEKVSYKKNPDGFLALSQVKYQKFSDLKLKKNPLVVVLESVEKPGNLGAIIRTAYASGVDLIILNDQKTDLYSPNVIRSSTGFIFSMPLVLSSVSDTIKWLKKENIKILTTSLSAEKNHFEIDFKLGTAIVFGSEAFGLSDLWLKGQVEQIKIPMISGVDSLNVSVSVAIIIYEAIRQRKYF